MLAQQKSLVAQQPQSQQLTTLDYYGTIQGFECGQRIAKMFASSNLVPDTFKGDIGGCLIALEMAQRMKANVLQVMQSLYIVHGKPSFSSAFLIACFNQTGRFTPIRYEFEGKEGKDDWGCRAITTDKTTGEEFKSTKVTIGMAKAEGWWSKKDRNGRETSKWQTMPELMLRYRSATFLIRTTAPEIALGFQTTEEIRDVIDITSQSQVMNGTPSLDEIAMQAVEESDDVTDQHVNVETGELLPDTTLPVEETKSTPQAEPNGTIDFKEEAKPRKVPTVKQYTIF